MVELWEYDYESFICHDNSCVEQWELVTSDLDENFSRDYDSLIFSYNTDTKQWFYYSDRQYNTYNLKLLNYLRDKCLESGGKKYVVEYPLRLTSSYLQI